MSSRQRKITLGFVILVALAAASPAMSTTGGRTA